MRHGTIIVSVWSIIGMFRLQNLGISWTTNGKVTFTGLAQSEAKKKVSVWDTVAEKIARPFSPWQGDTHSWCMKSDNMTCQGLLYLKVPKTASSTAAGVTFRIAEKVGAKMLNNSMCAHQWQHGISFSNLEKSYLLWTSVRDPATRALSEFFHFEVSRKGVEPTTEKLISMLNQRKNYQLRWQTKRFPEKLPEDALDLDIAANAIERQLLATYSFAAVAERMDESLVVMKLLFNLDDGDIIVLSSKKSGGYDDGKYKERCVKVQKAFTTPEVDEFIRTNFTEDNYDYLLYAAVNRSLDLTINALGRDRVEEEVRKYRMLKQLAEISCQDEAVFPCSDDGTRQIEASQASCYWNDAGCGHSCVDRVIKDFQNGRLNLPAT
jgi:hypothetical protein